MLVLYSCINSDWRAFEIGLGTPSISATSDIQTCRILVVSRLFDPTGPVTGFPMHGLSNHGLRSRPRVLLLVPFLSSRHVSRHGAKNVSF